MAILVRLGLVRARYSKARARLRLEKNGLVPPLEYSSFLQIPIVTFDFGSLLHTGLCSKVGPKSSYLGYIFRILYKLKNRELSILLRYQRTHKLSLQLKLNLVAEALNYEH